MPMVIHGDKSHAHSCMQTSKTHVMCWVSLSLYSHKPLRNSTGSDYYRSRFSITAPARLLASVQTNQSRDRIISFHLLFVVFFRLIYAPNGIVINSNNTIFIVTTIRCIFRMKVERFRFSM